MSTKTVSGKDPCPEHSSRTSTQLLRGHPVRNKMEVCPVFLATCDALHGSAHKRTVRSIKTNQVLSELLLIHKRGIFVSNTGRTRIVYKMSARRPASCSTLCIGRCWTRRKSVPMPIAKPASRQGNRSLTFSLWRPSRSGLDCAVNRRLCMCIFCK